MRDEGFSVREIARELGLSRMKVHRVLMASPTVPSVSDDPLVALLTEADVAHLGLSAADVAGGLNALQRYRMLGLPTGSAAGDAVRALAYRRGGEDGFGAWLHTGAAAGPQRS